MRSFVAWLRKKKEKRKNEGTLKIRPAAYYLDNDISDASGYI